MEYKVDIAGVEYGMTDIASGVIEQPLFSEFSVGNACSASMTLSFWQKSNIPRMAKLIPYARKASSDPWVKQGEFFTDTRKTENDLMTIEAFDAMLKAEIVWAPSQNLVFPMTMEAAANEIASWMGVDLDPRCSFNAGYTIDYPANNYTLRDVLCHIGAAHAGNWIITAEGRLLLVPLFASMPPEPQEMDYLADESGNILLIGGVRILV